MGVAGKPGDGSGLTRAIMRFLVGTNIEIARKRVRWAWVAGVVWAGMGAFNALTLFFGVESADRPQWTVAQFLFVLGEAAVLAALALGVRKRSRAAAIGLFCFFCISRIVSVAAGLIALVTWEDFARLGVQIIFAYLFFQGMRGALTYYYLTHPQYPTHAPVEAPGSSL